MMKHHVSLAVALSLACGLATADPQGSGLVPVAVSYHEAKDVSQVVGGRSVPAVFMIPTLEDYRHPAMRGDMRVASAGLVFDQVSMAEAPPGSIWM